MSGSVYPNHNVRVYTELREGRDWCQEQEVPVRVFTNFDGGGFNFYIFEFQLLEDARAFAKHLDIRGERSIWIEDENQKIHYVGES